ncbi:MAG: hypothetical protein ACFCD0_19250 [Gemmataceae bacterium]
MQVRCFTRLVPLCLVFLVGCSSATVRVRGKVTVDGKPAVAARVRFFAKDKIDSPPISEGRVQEDGSFVLTTLQPGDGVPSGTYKVVITWKNMTRSLGEERETGPDKLKGKYADPKKTPLEIEIRSSSPDAIFDLPKPK